MDMAMSVAAHTHRSHCVATYAVIGQKNITTYPAYRAFCAVVGSPIIIAAADNRVSQILRWSGVENARTASYCHQSSENGRHIASLGPAIQEDTGCDRNNLTSAGRHS